MTLAPCAAGSPAAGSPAAGHAASESGAAGSAAAPPVIAPPPPPPPAHDASVEEHDRYWIEHVYQGDHQRQLTLRAVLAGCVIGGVMSISNLYVGLKIGWGLGVAITSAVLAYSLFALLEGHRSHGAPQAGRH